MHIASQKPCPGELFSVLGELKVGKSLLELDLDICLFDRYRRSVLCPLPSKCSCQDEVSVVSPGLLEKEAPHGGLQNVTPDF